jgi:hypothetical protein
MKLLLSLFGDGAEDGLSPDDPMPFAVFEETATTEYGVLKDREVTTGDLMALAAATSGLIDASTVETLTGPPSEVIAVYATSTIVNLRLDAAGSLKLHVTLNR